jgi:hypothetical protein
LTTAPIESPFYQKQNDDRRVEGKQNRGASSNEISGDKHFGAHGLLDKSQTASSLPATQFYNFPSVACAHSFTEPTLFLTSSLARLIGALYHR